MTAVLATVPTAADALGLAPEQVRAAILLASGQPIGKVAADLGVDRRTLFHWRQQAAFAMAFERELAAQAQLIREAVHARLLGLAEKALDVVDTALDSGGAPALAAARVVLARAEPPPMPRLPSAADIRQQQEAERTRAAQERLSRMSDAELEATIVQLREQGAHTEQLQQEQLNRMSPAEQADYRRANGRAAAERLHARRQP